jgi:hypothetical protein
MHTDATQIISFQLRPLSLVIGYNSPDFVSMLPRVRNKPNVLHSYKYYTILEIIRLIMEATFAKCFYGEQMTPNDFEDVQKKSVFYLTNPGQKGI